MESCRVCCRVILEELTCSLKLCLFGPKESAFRERVYEEGGIQGTRVSGVTFHFSVSNTKVLHFYYGIVLFFK